MTERSYWDQPVTMAEAIAETLGAYGRTVDADRTIDAERSWQDRWGSVLDAIEHQLPSGSGIDAGTKIERGPSERWDPDTGFVLTAGWHAMDSNGYYAGWHDFRVIVRATFSGPSVDIEWTAGKSPEQDYDAELIDCAECGGTGYASTTGERGTLDDAALAELAELGCPDCGGTGRVEDPDVEWSGVSDPGDYLGDVYRDAMRALVTRGDFDPGAGERSAGAGELGSAPA